MTKLVKTIDTFEYDNWPDATFHLGEGLEGSRINFARSQTACVRDNQRRTIISGALLGLILILGTSVGAVAAPSNKSPGESNPGQVAQVEKIKTKIADAGGGRILGTKVVDYVPENSASPILMSYPGSCSLSVTLYVIYRTSTHSSVYNESSNYCPGATSSSLDMTIIKRDTITGWKTTVASSLGGWSGEAEYTCPTGNVSDFRAETWGQVTYNGTRYTASAYDGDAWSGFYRCNCG